MYNIKTNRFFLGIDGGGTKTIAILSLSISGEKTIIAEFKSGPGNFQLREQFYSTMDNIFSNIKTKISREFNDHQNSISICAGFAGVVGVKNSIEEIEQYFRSKINSFDNLESQKIKIISDAELVLNTYFDKNKSGIILISGTGSICLGKDRNNNLHRSGGFGHLIDDMGSGYYFGKQAIKLALNSKYNYNEKSILENYVKEYYNIEKIDNIINIAHNDKGKTVIASSSPLLFKAAENGCKFAKEEILIGIKGLSKYINSCLKSIGEENCTVILHGTIFKSQMLVFDTLVKNNRNLNFKIADKRAEIAALDMV